MRRAGLRLVQLWIPDARAPGFVDECRKQSRRAGRSRRLEKEAMTWIDATRDTDGWTA
ncbi:MAG TPA: antitoxin MazE-like protein [Gemmatimonadaceae bacterium]|nr:antitoxin MazE-like protein [Gemmatimonadaceae bacterium]